MNPIIEIKNISKKYLIAHQNNPYLTLRESLQKLARRKQQLNEEFWALNDVSFNVMPGDSIGIIGKNGAGKSTLLKILSRITPPTKGKIIARGRIASLLEVGTGFHSELSGRENIFLNGSILGLKRIEIQSKFDEIVEFSGVEKFLDLPIKHYSSGMQLRLAFAVAAHLEPEILVIDEVLAVGDAEFQKKCLSKMGDVAKSGRTIFFVSHNMGAVQLLCNRAIMLENGELKMSGNVNNVIEHYHDITLNQSSIDYTRKGNGSILFYEFYLSDERNEITSNFYMGNTIIINFKLHFKINAKSPIIGIEIRNNLEECFAHIINEDTPVPFIDFKKGDIVNMSVELPELFFTPSRYFISLWVGDQSITPSDYLYNCMYFDLHQGNKVFRKSPYPQNVKFYQRSIWKRI